MFLNGCKVGRYCKSLQQLFVFGKCQRALLLRNILIDKIIMKVKAFTEWQSINSLTIIR